LSEDHQAEQTEPLTLAARYPAATGDVLAAVQALENGTSPQKKNALGRLGKMGTAAKAAVPACMALLNDADPSVRVHAAVALYRVDQQTQPGVSVLISGLHDEDIGVRSLSAWGIGEIGSAAKEAVAALKA